MHSEAAIVPGSRWRALVGLMIAPAMQAADATIVNVALPRVEESLGASAGLGSWVVTIYLVAAAVVAPLTGTCYRRYGSRTVFTAAITAFVLASLLCAASPSMPALILFRLLQGAAGGILQPAAQAALLDIYPRRDHGRVQAIWGAAIMVGPVVGPVLGGMITDLISWRFIFVINLPLGVIAMLGLRVLPRYAGAREANPIDFQGLALLGIALAALQLCLQRGIGRNWLQSPDLLIESAIAAVAAGMLAWCVARSRFTLFSFAVFRDLHFTVANFFNFVVFALLYVTVVFLPALSEGPFGFGASVAGIAVSPRAAAMLLAVVGVGYVMGRVEHRILLGIGLVIMSAGLMLLSRPAAGDLVWLGLASAIQGAGAGILLAPMSTLAFSTLPPALRADAAGVYLLLRQLGGAAGVAAMTAVLLQWTQTRADALVPQATALGVSPGRLLDMAQVAAYADCFRLMALVIVATLPVLLLFGGSRSRTAQVPSEAALKMPEPQTPSAAIPGRDRDEPARSAR